MTIADLRDTFDYCYWANKKLFDVVTGLTPEQFTQPVAGSFGSVRNTMVHVLSAEWGWLDRCGGPQRGAALKAEDYPTLESLLSAWIRVQGYVREFFSTLTDEDLTRIVEYPNPRGEKRAMALGELLQHAAIHGVHHRGQVAMLLRLLGYAPGNFDILFYYAEKRGVSAWL